MTLANYRVPSRPAERATWDEVKMQVLALWEAGYGSEMAEILARPEAHANQHAGEGLRPATVRGYYQRIYNEYRLEPGRRTPAAALAVAYRRGDLPCPCPHPARAESDPSTPDELVAQLEREIQKYRRRQSPQQPGQGPKAAPPAQPRAEESYLDRINRVREEGRRGVGVPPETYLDRINRIRGGPGKV